jgi:hypothetical protein
MTKKKINVRGIEIAVSNQKDEDYISLTDMARFKNADEPKVQLSFWVFGKKLIIKILKGSNSTPLKMRLVAMLLCCHLRNCSNKYYLRL